MTIAMTRRRFIGAGAGLAGLTLAGCTTVRTTETVSVAAPLEDRTFGLNYGPRPDEQFPLPAISPAVLEPRFRRSQVDYATPENPGSLVVDTRTFYLYLVEPGGTAMRYGVGIGRQGFEWSGRAHVAWKRPSTLACSGLLGVV